MNSPTPMTKVQKIFAPFFAIVFTLILCLTGSPVYAAMPDYTTDEAVYAVETTSGEVVSAYHAHKRMYPASTTKMMTTLVALDYVADKLDKQVTVGDEVDLVTSDSSKADIRKGDKLTWRQLFYALLLPSGNDAALSIACHVGRIASNDNDLSASDAIEKFVALMNKKAKALGLENSHFVNPHGLHDPDHYTTAADLVRISQQALKNKTIRRIVKTEVYSCHLASGDKKWINTNSLIINPDDLYKMTESHHTGAQYNASATGVKTGSTDAAGHCLVFSSDNGSKKILAVILHSDNMYPQANAIINTVNSYTRIYWTKKDGYYKTVKLSHVHMFDSRELVVRTSGRASSVVPKKEKARYSSKLVLKKSLFETGQRGKTRLIADIASGQKIGTINILNNGKVVRRIDVKAAQTIHARGISDTLFVLLIIALVVLAVLYLYARRVARQRRRREQRKKRLIARGAKPRSPQAGGKPGRDRKTVKSTRKADGHKKRKQKPRR